MVQFLRKVEQTLKIRNYAANSRKSYLYQVSGFLRWHGNLPHTITRQRDLSASNAARLASRPERIFLTGITVGLTNQNWVQLTMPEDDQWAAPLAKLSTSMIDRINSPEFYETIRLQICKRFLAQC